MWMEGRWLSLLGRALPPPPSRNTPWSSVIGEAIWDPVGGRGGGVRWALGVSLSSPALNSGLGPLLLSCPLHLAPTPGWFMLCVIKRCP